MNVPDSAFLPHNTLVGEIYRVNIAFIAVTALIIGVRLIVRGAVVKHVAVDDYLMVAAGVFAIAFSGMAIVGPNYGLGHHVWDLPQDNDLLMKAKKVIQILWVCQVLYATALMLVKISIVASYLRVFPTKIFRWIMYILSTAIVAVWICSILVTIFQCKPIRGAWDFTLPRNCLEISKFFYFSTAFSIFTDFSLCTLPLPVFYSLKLPTRQKVIISSLFAIGLFAAVASALRMSVLGDVDSLDVTMGSVPTLKWSVVEVGTGIICACIPALKPLFKSLFPDKRTTRSPHGPSDGPASPRSSRIPQVVEDQHELTKTVDGWTSWSRPISRIKAAPVVTTQTFV